MASSSRIDSLKKQYSDNQKRYFAALANEYRKAGDLAQSIALCRQHLPEQPNHISGHIVFGQALFEAGELAESRTVFETALALDPENLIALRHLGDIASQAGDPNAAREWYTRILHADPRNEEIQGLLRSLPDAPATADVVDAAPETSAEMSGWAAELAAEAPETTVASRASTPQSSAPVPPAADLAPVTTAIVEAYTPPASADTPPTRPATPLGADPFDLDFGAGNDMGLGVHLAAEPLRPPSPTPPIAMEAIFEEARTKLNVPPAADITTSGSHAIFPDDREAAVQDDLGTEPVGGRNISEEMEAIFGAPEGQAEAASSSRDEMGVEDMEFRAPEREVVDEATYAEEEEHAAAAGLAAGTTPQAFVTETMAELYLQQGFREEALNVYRQLLAQNPHDRSLRERVAALESGARASVSIVAMPELQGAAPAEPVTAPAAPEEQTGPPEREQTYGDSDEPAAAAAAPSAPAGPRTARDFFSALATRRAPVREPMAEVAEYGYDAREGGNDRLAAELSGPPHTSEPVGFEGSTGTGILGHHAPTVSEGDVAAGAPVTATPEPDEPAPDAVYHPALDEEPTTHHRRTSVPDMLAAAFDGDGEEQARAEPDSGVVETFEEGPVDRLFGGREVPSEDQQAARSLASAFTGEHEHSAPPSGKPTRPAEGELSLDRVFRTPHRSGTPIASPPVQHGASPTPSRGSASFSFDQFFADSEGGSEAPAQPSADPGEVAASDIEQFNSWLEGLKKK